MDLINIAICGGRKISHLEDNIKAIGIRLTDEDIKEIESAYEFDIGFPHTMIAQHPSGNFLLNSVAYTEYTDVEKPIHSDD
jgi:hypothetical protein